MRNFNNRIAELYPVVNSVKSFYGKALVITGDDGNIYLRSYETIVGYITPDGEFHRTWEYYSQTTMRHVNDFLAQYSRSSNGGGSGKSWWDKLKPVPVPEFAEAAL